MGPVVAARNRRVHPVEARRSGLRSGAPGDHGVEVRAPAGSPERTTLRVLPGQPAVVGDPQADVPATGPTGCASLVDHGDPQRIRRVSRDRRLGGVVPRVRSPVEVLAGQPFVDHPGGERGARRGRRARGRRRIRGRGRRGRAARRLRLGARGDGDPRRVRRIAGNVTGVHGRGGKGRRLPARRGDDRAEERRCERPSSRTLSPPVRQSDAPIWCVAERRRAAPDWGARHCRRADTTLGPCDDGAVTDRERRPHRGSSPPRDPLVGVERLLLDGNNLLHADLERAGGGAPGRAHRAVAGGHPGRHPDRDRLRRAARPGPARDAARARAHRPPRRPAHGRRACSSAS